MAVQTPILGEPTRRRRRFYIRSPKTFGVTITFLVGFVILGIANLHVTQRVLRQEAESWQETGVISLTGTLLAASSIAFWTLAVVFGRLIAYL